MVLKRKARVKNNNLMANFTDIPIVYSTTLRYLPTFSSVYSLCNIMSSICTVKYQGNHPPCSDIYS